MLNISLNLETLKLIKFIVFNFIKNPNWEVRQAKLTNGNIINPPLVFSFYIQYKMSISGKG